MEQKQIGQKLSDLIKTNYQKTICADPFLDCFKTAIITELATNNVVTVPRLGKIKYHPTTLFSFVPDARFLEKCSDKDLKRHRKFLAHFSSISFDDVKLMFDALLQIITEELDDDCRFSWDTLFSFDTDYELDFRPGDLLSTISLPESVIQPDFDRDVCKAFVKAGGNINGLAANGKTPLLSMCEAGDVHRAEILIEEGATVGLDALLRACEVSNPDMVRLFLKHGANPNPSDEELEAGDNETCLMVACRTGCVEIVSLLLDAGADPHFEYGLEQSSALLLARQSGSLEVIQLLLEKSKEGHEDFEKLSTIIADSIEAHPEFGVHEELVSLAQTLRVLDTCISVDGGNADDKYDSMIAEIGLPRLRLSQFSLSNWSYALWYGWLKHHKANGDVVTLLERKNDNGGVDLFELRAFAAFAQELGLGALTLDITIKFFTFLMGRLAQRSFFKDLCLEGYQLFPSSPEENLVDPNLRKVPLSEIIFDSDGSRRSEKF